MEIVPDGEIEEIIDINGLPTSELLKRQAEAAPWLRKFWKLRDWKDFRGDNVAQDLERFTFAMDALLKLAGIGYRVPPSE